MEVREGTRATTRTVDPGDSLTDAAEAVADKADGPPGSS